MTQHQRQLEVTAFLAAAAVVVAEQMILHKTDLLADLEVMASIFWGLLVPEAVAAAAVEHPQRQGLIRAEPAGMAVYMAAAAALAEPQIQRREIVGLALREQS